MTRAAHIAAVNFNVAMKAALLSLLCSSLLYSSLLWQSL